MGNFVVFLPKDLASPSAPEHFRTALHYTNHFKALRPNNEIQTPWSYAASYPRVNGSGPPMVIDQASQCWLLATGTWLHMDNFQVGDEAKLLDRYLAVGANQLGKELDGFFAIIIGDARTKTTHVITDLIGSCHVFNRANPEGQYLSGSSLVLASLGGYELDTIACQEYLHSGIIYEERTVYQQVRKLPPACVTSFPQDAPKHCEKYWHINHSADEILSGQQAVDTLWDALQTSVRRIDQIPARKVCDLTGGYDSRALAAALIGAQVPFSTTVSGPKQSMDVVVSFELAKLTGVAHQHTFFPTPIEFSELQEALAFTDGEYDLADYARILRTHRQLMSNFDLSLNGSFCEVARGYWWELLFPQIGKQQPLDSRKLARLRFAPSAYDASLITPSDRLNMVEHYTAVINRTNQGLLTTPNTLQMDNTYLTMRMQRWQGRIASSTDQLWPCLSPFIFREVLEAMLKIKPSLRLRSLVIRKMLASYLPSLAQARLEHGQPAAPANWSNFYRFSPLLIYYGKKVVQKAWQKIGIAGSTDAPRTQATPLHLRLWQTPQVSELLNPSTMRLSSILDEAALADFLHRSKTPGFAYTEQWTRLLSLELALQAIHQANAEAQND